MAQINVSNLTFGYEGSYDTIFENVSFSIDTSWKLGFVGRNGKGKTTFLQLLLGKYEYQGAITRSVVFDYFPYPVKQKDLERTAAELMEDWKAGVESWRVLCELEKLDMDAELLYRPFGTLSFGERTRVMLAVLFSGENDFLLIDEPTNHLDLETMDWLETYLKAYRGAVLVVSHDRYFLDSVCTRIWELRGKTITTYRGNYSAYLPQREAADERLQKQHDADVEKAAKLQDYIDRNLVRASTTKMAQSRRKQLEKLEITEAPQAEAHQLNFRFEYDIEPYDELVIMKGLTIRIGERTLLEALDYVVHRGDKLIIAGPNGTGKSTLLQVLDGKRRPSGGMVRLGTGAKPGIFVQQQTRRAGRVIDAIWNQYPRFTELEVRSHLARFGYRGEEVFKDCATLSGGEMARLRFAELALERPNLMFLDEPTNHLDIFMRETLTDALSAYTGTLLLVTHDRYLMQTLGCPILYLEDGKATFYQNFQKLHDRDTSKQPEPAKQEDKPQKAGYGKEQRRRRAEVRTRLKALETEIEELGAHIVELENEINDPEVLRDHLLLRDKCDELDDSRFHQQELYDEWEKLAEEQDRMDAESDS